MTITTPGQYAISDADYFADPCPGPSLSSSLARVLLSSSPLHAWYQSPRLNPAWRPEESEAFDLGHAAHAYLLQGETGFVIIDAPDWKTKAARGERELARLDRKVPLLREQWERVVAMATAARKQLAGHAEPPPPLAGQGKPERTLIWQEGPIWCRAKLDWLHDDHRTVEDYKSTAMSANPAEWTRTLFNTGADVQAAFYLRGVKAVHNVEAEFRFVVQENFLPYALAVVGLGPDAMTLAEKKVARAIAVWQECLARNVWPGYPIRTVWADLPPWEETRFLESELIASRPSLLDDGRPLEEQLFGRIG